MHPTSEKSIATRDEAPPSGAETPRTRFFTVAALGEKRQVTPEGYLVCYDVPIARTGFMWYAEGETPIPAVNGRVKVIREDSEVFRPEFMASFNGKPVVNNHPAELVGPSNWARLVVGNVFNVRRGTSMNSDLLLADLMICDPGAIAAIDEGKREVSCGYDAQYTETGPGEGRQYGMVGNHLALVDSGRCGQRCSIGDQDTIGEQMYTRDEAPKSNFSKFVDGLKAAVKRGGTALDEFLSDPSTEASLKPVRDDAIAPEKGDLHVHVGGDRKMSDEDIEKRFGEHGEALKKVSDSVEKLIAHTGYKEADAATSGEEKTKVPEEKETEGALKEEAPVGTGDAAIKATKDSSLLQGAWTETVAAAEIIVPGCRPVQTFDRAAAPKATLDSLCGFRRTVLDLTYHQSEGRGMVERVMGGKTFDAKTMPCTDIRKVFFAVAAMRRMANDAMLARRDDTRTETGKPKAPTTAAELNARNREHYSGAGKK